MPQMEVDAGSSALVVALQDEIYVRYGGDLAPVFIVPSSFIVEPSALAPVSNTTDQTHSASMSVWMWLAAGIAVASLLIAMFCRLRKACQGAPKAVPADWEEDAWWSAMLHMEADAGGSALVVALQDEIYVRYGGYLASVLIARSSFIVERSAHAP